LLLSGKIHFGYIYGFSVFGCLALWMVLNLMSSLPIDLWRVCSVLGYCLLPVIGLAFISVILNLRGLLGLVLGALSVCWATHSSTRMLDAVLSLTDQYFLVAYPIALLYSCFVLITVF
jgi:hypothetical protein